MQGKSKPKESRRRAMQSDEMVDKSASTKSVVGKLGEVEKQLCHRSS